MDETERTAAFMTPAKLAQMKQQPGASPGMLLEQVEADAQAVSLGRVRDLLGLLAAQAQERDCAPLAAALGGFAEELRVLDFDLLQPKGWLARATGKAHSAGTEFAGQFDRIVQAARQFGAQAQALAKQQQGQLAAAERTLLELEVETRASAKVQEQGSRALHDMRDQLKARQAAAPDEAQLRAIKEEAARCERLLARLKELRACATLAQQADEQARALATRRSALVQAVAGFAGQQVKAWEAGLGPLAAAASEGAAEAPAVEQGRGVHRELHRAVGECLAECAEVDGQERSLAALLAALREQLPAGA